MEAGIAEGRIIATMTIADAKNFAKAHQPRPEFDGRVEDPEVLGARGSHTRKEFLAVLWDDLNAAPMRAPEKSYGAKLYPNLVFFHLYAPGDTRIGFGSQHDLTPTALFVVPVEQGVLAKDKQGRPICKATCRLLTLLVRGDVPEPTVVPGQIVEGGYEGVLQMISSMFPNALKAASTSRCDEVPGGWQLIPRECKDTYTTKPSEAVPESIEKLNLTALGKVRDHAAVILWDDFGNTGPAANLKRCHLCLRLSFNTQVCAACQKVTCSSASCIALFEQGGQSVRLCKTCHAEADWARDLWDTQPPLPPNSNEQSKRQ